MIYLTAIRLTPGGSSTHLHKQYIEQHNRHKQNTEQHNSQIRKSADRALSLRGIPWHLPTTEEKAQKNGELGKVFISVSLHFGPLSPQHSASSFCRYQCPQMWTVSANILNKQWRTTNKKWCLSCYGTACTSTDPLD